MVRQIFVDSRDRISGTSSDFAIQLPQTLVIEGGNSKCRIDNFRFPVVIPTIRTGYNDTFSVKEGATTYTVTLPQANYDGPTLASTLQALLFAAAPGAWTVTYDASNIAMSVSCTNAFSVVGGTYAAQLMTHPYTSTSNSYSFTYVSMLGIDMVYISSPQFSSLDTFGPSGASDTMMCAVVTVPYGSVLDANMPQDVWIDVPAMTTQQLSFQIRDRSYNVLTATPNISFVLSID